MSIATRGAAAAHEAYNFSHLFSILQFSHTIFYIRAGDAVNLPRAN